jgi:hypothetical protein
MASANMNVGWKRIAASLLFLIIFDSALKFTFLAIDDLQSGDEISAKTRPLDPADRVNTAVTTEHFTDTVLILVCLGLVLTAVSEHLQSADSVAHRTRPPPDHVEAV